MSLRFWILAGIYHAVLLAACAVRARAWLKRGPASLGAVHFWRAVAVDAFLCGSTACLLAIVLGTALPDPPFAVIRFWSQALFGEVFLFLLFLSALLLRSQLAFRSAVMAAAAIVLLAVYVDAYHVEPHGLRVEKHEVDLRGRLPAHGGGRVRLLHVSDIQTHRVGEYERRLVRAAAKLEPDLLILTGDYVHERLRPGREDVGRELVELLAREGPRPPMGIWAVGGDTDGPLIARQLRESGVGWLDDEAVTLQLPGGVPLSLIGLTAAASRGAGREALTRLLEQAPPDSLRIVFGHAPDFALGVPTHHRIDLALAGHTHGGQVVLPFFGPLLTLSEVPRHVAAGGVHQLGPVRVHVSRGVGMERGSAPQIRFLCPPEICLLALEY
jgi:predicted MPP superfamily phosphohydrolase